MLSDKARIAALEEKLANIEHEIKAHNSHIKRNIVNHTETTKINNSVLAENIDNETLKKTIGSSSSTANINSNTSHVSYVTNTGYTQTAAQANYEIMGATVSGNTYGAIATTKIAATAKASLETGGLSNITDIAATKLTLEMIPNKTNMKLSTIEETVSTAVATEINNVRSEVALATTAAIASSTKTIASDVKVAMSRIDTVESQVDLVASKVTNVAQQTHRGLYATACALTEQKTHSMIITNAAMQVLS
ncbi:hypothetical protein ACGP04_07045 [Piscirickettsia salmonis]|uniref:hypothetical protein n=1 Tax=Piscirickettsia salmonis TaxID=1238 RepID=UPI000F08FEBE|nr:hypothetical protein DA717_01305 [Piscirickettsiaceae bacterium NZ-RLO2]